MRFIHVLKDLPDLPSHCSSFDVGALYRCSKRAVRGCFDFFQVLSIFTTHTPVN